MRIKRCGFKVLTVTLDGSSVNQKFMQIISTPNTTLPHKFKIPLGNNTREIFLLSDPSHLIKTARNCLANQSRNIHVHVSHFSIQLLSLPSLLFCPIFIVIIIIILYTYNGNPISWRFIVKLYHILTESTGLTVLLKIKYEHIFITNFSKIRVDLVAQVSQI